MEMSGLPLNLRYLIYEYKLDKTAINMINSVFLLITFALTRVIFQNYFAIFVGIPMYYHRFFIPFVYKNPGPNELNFLANMQFQITHDEKLVTEFQKNFPNLHFSFSTIMLITNTLSQLLNLYWFQKIVNTAMRACKKSGVGKSNKINE